MNEQMKAVGRQAGLVFIEDGVYGQRWYSSKCGLDAAEYEKLVELIVRECVAQCEQVAKDADTISKSTFVTDVGRMIHEGMWGGAKNCTAQIQTHFGVNDEQTN